MFPLKGREIVRNTENCMTLHRIPHNVKQQRSDQEWLINTRTPKVCTLMSSKITVVLRCLSTSHMTRMKEQSNRTTSY